MKNLKTISFSIHIDSDREKIWSVLWNPATYEKWTSVFSEGSHYKGELKQGSTIRFLGKDGGGMSSLIEKIVENEQMVFAHQKELKNGCGNRINVAGCKGNLLFEKKKPIPVLNCRLSWTSRRIWKNTSRKLFPKALALVKQISER